MDVYRANQDPRGVEANDPVSCRQHTGELGNNYGSVRPNHPMKLIKATGLAIISIAFSIAVVYYLTNILLVGIVIAWLYLQS